MVLCFGFFFPECSLELFSDARCKVVPRSSDNLELLEDGIEVVTILGAGVGVEVVIILGVGVGIEVVIILGAGVGVEKVLGAEEVLSDVGRGVEEVGVDGRGMAKSSTCSSEMEPVKRDFEEILEKVEK